jgi:hypothetical protein
MKKRYTHQSILETRAMASKILSVPKRYCEKCSALMAGQIYNGILKYTCINGHEVSA